MTHDMIMQICNWETLSVRLYIFCPKLLNMIKFDISGFHTRSRLVNLISSHTYPQWNPTLNEDLVEIYDISKLKIHGRIITPIFLQNL